ncbi:SdpA family antimicrobial peptide system protein [Bacillus thuringiensis]|uniref:SdpA family antimicrobial peptide system protein n=1 Tax=Bacillus thuringiensis TaxID=1428 RepID=UPI000BEB3890|nr:SdpA family antimicrobial peptide system protein [Bacillus thuringiensis]PDY26976.1 SdpA family antimicrobial peptide system protein [Bacillus thuringiensis]PGH92602.1 SdpA family antimicrobial peptide system protein [Bacillus thuringiensis]
MQTKSISLFIGFSLIWGLLFLSSILSGLGSNPLSMNKDTNLIISSVLPQGWGFFSKDPRENQVGLYAEGKDSLEVLWPNMKAKNVFGLYRKGRSQGVEMGTLTSKIKEQDWMECSEGNLQTCKKKADEKPIKLDNPVTYPLLCGGYYMTKEKPVPWNYYKYSDSAYKVTNIVKVDVACSKK